MADKAIPETRSILREDMRWPLRGAPDFDGSFAFSLTDPGDRVAAVTAVQHPWCFGFKAPVSSGRAMLVLAGGGYTALMVEREGAVAARWLNSLGIDAFVLVHRFPNAENGHLAPVEDAIEAMRGIRARGYGSSRLGVLGLSSGGHLAASLVTNAVHDLIGRSDDQDMAGIPDALIIGYAPISTNAKGRTVVAGKPALEPREKQQLYDQVQPDRDMIEAPPPMFVIYSANDPVVPVENAYRLKQAATERSAAIELHVFADAPHGFAFDVPDQPVSLWPILCAAWLRQIGFLDR